MMLVDFDHRGAGKTDRMIEWLKADDARLMLVHAHQSWLSLCKKWPDVSDRIMTWQAYWSRRPIFTKANKRINEIGIDSADRVLQRLAFHPIGRISVTHYTDPDDGPWGD